MFGYITAAPGTLKPEQQARYRACYCGLCHTLKHRHGQLSRLTLSYDMTFLYILLCSLYEPEETEAHERCLPRPFKAHAYTASDVSVYCADMNVALAYHKLRDDWADERSLDARAAMAFLEKPYARVKAAYPDKCALIEECLTHISIIEKAGEYALDAPANLTSEMLGAIYRFGEDEWSDTLEQMGSALGRFIYLMDAYDDLPRDEKRRRYNPLKPLKAREDYEEYVKAGLTMLIAEATEAFETLPLVQDIELMRNVLYAGCWTRYRKKRKREQGREDGA